MVKWIAADMPAQTGKTVLVTGANSGIGFQTALELARAGATVLLASRNRKKAEDALLAISKEIPKAAVEFVELDLADLASVRACAEAVNARPGALDILINNAGVMAVPERMTTVDGFELQFGTNHLGHFALTGLLLPSLRRNPSARVVTVSSVAHKRAVIDFHNLQGQRGYKAWDAYNQSKLANLWFAFELERKFLRARLKLKSIAAHPGVSATNIVNGGPKLGGAIGFRTLLISLAMPFLGQPDSMGALPSLYAATAPDVMGGSYYGPDGTGELRGHPVKVWANTMAMDEVKAAQLWSVSEELTGIAYGPLLEPVQLSAPPIL
jgi:NAD(P)-dependent dehydrogenase (short-subunit alcohol dehydrogenase family)